MFFGGCDCISLIPFKFSLISVSYSIIFWLMLPLVDDFCWIKTKDMNGKWRCYKLIFTRQIIFWNLLTFFHLQNDVWFLYLNATACRFLFRAQMVKNIPVYCARGVQMCLSKWLHYFLISLQHECCFLFNSEIS